MAGTLTYYVKNLIELKSKDESALDIVSSSWLRNLPDSDELCSLSPLEFLSIKKETRLKMGVHFDRFGDSYTELLNVETLKKCFENMDSDVSVLPMVVYFKDFSPYSFIKRNFFS